jgi:hypothetical protein
MPSYKPTGNLRWVKNHPKAEDGRLMLQQEMSDSQGGIRWDDVLVYDISECLDMTGGPPDPTQPPEALEDPDPKTIVEAEIKKALIRSHNWKSGIVVSIRPLGSSYATGFVALVTWAGGNASEECHEPLCLGMSEEVLTVLAQYVAKKLSISLGKFLIEEGDKPIASINVQG